MYLCVFVSSFLPLKIYSLFFVDNNSISSFSFSFLSIVFTDTMFGEFLFGACWSPSVCSAISAAVYLAGFFTYREQAHDVTSWISPPFGGKMRM